MLPPGVLPAQGQGARPLHPLRALFFLSLMGKEEKGEGTAYAIDIEDFVNKILLLFIDISGGFIALSLLELKSKTITCLSISTCEKLMWQGGVVATVSMLVLYQVYRLSKFSYKYRGSDGRSPAARQRHHDLCRWK